MVRLLSLTALLLVACGGGKPAWVERQRALLDEDDVVAGPAAPVVEGATTGIAAPGAAPPLTAREASSNKCVGFTPARAAPLLTDLGGFLM